VLEKGRIAAAGTHEQLLAESPLYRGMTRRLAVQPTHV
jgi:ABC-type multidrug transport system fused ATPase/permease subunit